MEWKFQQAHVKTFRREVFQLQAVQLHLLTEWKPQKAHVKTFRRKAFHMQTVQIFLYNCLGNQTAYADSQWQKEFFLWSMRLQKCEVRATQRNTCFPIVERSPSFAVSVTSEVHTLLIWKGTRSFTVPKRIFAAINATTKVCELPTLRDTCGEKLFSCNDCNYKSSRIDTLKRHEHVLGHNSDENGQKIVV